MTNKTQYLNADGEYFEVEGNEAHYMTEDELYDTSNSFQNTLEDLRMEFQDLVYLWLGHANFVWSTLTPDELTILNQRCDYIKKTVRYFLEDVYRVLGTRGSDDYGMTAADYEDEIYCNHEFELSLMQVIQKSFEFSSGKSKDLDGIIDLEWFEQKYAGTWMLRLLKPVTVKPWSCLFRLLWLCRSGRESFSRCCRYQTVRRESLWASMIYSAMNPSAAKS